MNPRTLGFVGVGQMGGRMVGRLVAAGHAVWAYDLDAAVLDAAVARGAKRASSLAEVARESSVVFLSLSSPRAVREVVLGAAGLCATGGFECLIDHSTTGLEVAREIAAGLAKAGIAMIDAPVSGGVRGAEAGSLSIMIAAKPEVFAKYQDLIGHIGTKIFQVGTEPGQAQAMKLVNNMISSAAMVATAEGMVLGVKAGLDPAVMLDVLNASTGKNSHTEDKFPKYILPRTFDFGFKVGLLHKDVTLGLQMAEGLGVPTPVITGAKQIWNVALAEGGPDKDMTTIVQYLERWGGAEVKAKPKATPAK